MNEHIAWGNSPSLPPVRITDSYDPQRTPFLETSSSLLLGFEFQTHRTFERVDFLEALPGDGLQVPVHAGGRFENSEQFAVALGSLLVHPLAFLVEVTAQFGELFGDAFDAMFEARTSEVGVDQLRFGFLPLI